MEFLQKTKKKVHSVEFEELEKQYPFGIMLYKEPPTNDITLQELKEITVDRLKLLRILERTSVKYPKILSDEWKTSFFNELINEGLKYYVRLIQHSGNSSMSNHQLTEADLHARRKDYISHFMLRFSYCTSDDLRDWFWLREKELFRLKFSFLSSKDIAEFLQKNNLSYQPISEEEKNSIKDGLYTSTIGQSVTKIETVDFYKIHFTEVLDLIRFRKCYLKSGYAYVGSHDFLSIVLVQLRASIKNGLETSFYYLPTLTNDERIYKLITSLHKSYTGKDYTLSKGSIVPIESIDSLSKKSFPLCMRDCHEQLRTNHHLKYGGRLQYALFLKGIGVQMEDCITMWREEFAKSIDMKKFKEHEYLIQHSYGKRGAMKDYKPQSCITIISQQVGWDQVHGCPFKRCDNTALKKKLTGHGLSIAHTQEICEYATKGHYQIACGRYLEISHQENCDTGIQHPNQYFELSQSIMEKRVASSSSSSATKSKTDIVLKKVKNTTNSLDLDDDILWNKIELMQYDMDSQDNESMPQINIEI